MDFWKLITYKERNKIFFSVLAIVLVSAILYFNPLFSNKPLGLDAFSHLSKVSYLKANGFSYWDMSWYNGTPFLKFYSPLFYYLAYFLPLSFFSLLFLCFLSIMLCSIGIFFLVRFYTKDIRNSLIASLLFLSIINISYYFISVGNYPFIFAIWAIPFTLLFLEKTIHNKKSFFFYLIFFLIGFLSHIFIGFILIFLVFMRILFLHFDFKKILKNIFLLLVIPIGLTSFWLLPFLSRSSSFVGDEIFIPKLLSLFGIHKTLTWGIGLDSIGMAFLFFVILILFIKKDFRDKDIKYYFFASLLLFILLMGALGHYYPKGIGSIRFIVPFSAVMCVFIGISLHKKNFNTKINAIIFVLLLLALIINYNVINSNYKDHSYYSDDQKFEQFGTIYKDFSQMTFIQNNFSNYRFGSARFPFSRDLTFVFPFISQTSGYFDQGIIYEKDFYKMKESIWENSDLNKTLYYLDWYGIKFFEVSGGYLSYANKFDSPFFELVFERKNNTYHYKVYEYKNPTPLISVIKGNFVSFEELNDSFIDLLASKNDNIQTIIPFISKKDIKIANNYSILDYSFERNNPDLVKINFDKFSGQEGILFKESYSLEWEAHEYPQKKPIEIYKTSNNFMFVIPDYGANEVIFYYSKSLLDHIGIFISLFFLIVSLLYYYLGHKITFPE